MIQNSFIESKKTNDKNNKIIIELAISINKELFNEHKISYKMFKSTEEILLKQLNTKHTTI